MPDDEKGLRCNHELRAEGLPRLDVEEAAQQVWRRCFCLGAWAHTGRQLLAVHTAQHCLRQTEATCLVT